MNQRLIYLLAVFALNIVTPSVFAEQERPFQSVDSEGVVATRDDRSVYLSIDAEVKGSVVIPRLAASLRSMKWEGSDADHGLQLKPEQETWVISWKERPVTAQRLVLEFDSSPLLPKEAKPTTASGDGSFYLPAHLAMPRGEKIRYEPQPFKNTIGYWVGKKDTATWFFKIDKPGRFNVAILQGCGRGQGGSTATLSFARALEKSSDLTLGFTVVETGHFQNFQWHHLGEVELKHADVIWLSIAPDQIKKAALMDIRAIHLTRLPDK